MIAFVDVPPGIRFLPQAAELNDDQVVTFFSPLVGKRSPLDPCRATTIGCT